MTTAVCAPRLASRWDHAGVPGEAARLLGGSDDTLRRWADAGPITSTTTESGRRGVDGAELARVATALAADTDEAVPWLPAFARNQLPGLVTRVIRDQVKSPVEIQVGTAPDRVAGPTRSCQGPWPATGYPSKAGSGAGVSLLRQGQPGSVDQRDTGRMRRGVREHLCLLPPPGVDRCRSAVSVSRGG